MGDWKLVADHKKPFELYDLRAYRGESQNSADQFPEKVTQMAEEWTRHMEEFRVIATEDLPPGRSAKNERSPPNQAD